MATDHSLIHCHLITIFEVVSLCSKNRKLELVKMLLADASSQNFSNQTPLEVANQLNCKHMKQIVAVLKDISIKQKRPRKYFEKHDQWPIPWNNSDIYLLHMPRCNSIWHFKCPMINIMSPTSEQLQHYLCTQKIYNFGIWEN